MARHTHPELKGTQQARRRTWRPSSAKCENGKIRYAQRHNALLALRDCRVLAGAQSRLGLPVSRRERRVYSCASCSGWHLTSQPARVVNPTPLQQTRPSQALASGTPARGKPCIEQLESLAG